VVNTAGEVLNYLGMHRDITEVHRLESQVRNQKALIESVVDAAPMVIALLDVDDRVVLDNHEYKKLQADLGMAEPAPMLMSAVRASLELDSGRGRRTSGYLFLDREVRLDPPGGRSPRWFSCSGSRVREDDGAADAFLAGQGRDYLLLVAKEITSLRLQQEKVRVAALQVVMADEDRVSGLRESLAAATFRLEGPLNMMASVVGMLARRQGETDPMSVALAEAITAGQQALKDLRSMIPGETREAIGAVNLNELLRDVLDLSTGRLLAAGITVIWKPQAMLPALQGRRTSCARCSRR
jgi:nitrogen fixation negative regulator NifL